MSSVTYLLITVDTVRSPSSLAAVARRREGADRSRYSELRSPGGVADQSVRDGATLLAAEDLL
jgi:hypothetical protein